MKEEDKCTKILGKILMRKKKQIPINSFLINRQQIIHKVSII